MVGFGINTWDLTINHGQEWFIHSGMKNTQLEMQKEHAYCNNEGEVMYEKTPLKNRRAHNPFQKPHNEPGDYKNHAAKENGQSI